jgi:hypothetical protein
VRGVNAGCVRERQELAVQRVVKHPGKVLRERRPRSLGVDRRQPETAGWRRPFGGCLVTHRDAAFRSSKASVATCRFAACVRGLSILRPRLRRQPGTGQIYQQMLTSAGNIVQG